MGRVALWLAAAALGEVVLGNALLLGIPGALWMAVGGPIAALFTDRQMPGDSAWPMAIMLTILWPWAMPLAYLAAARFVLRGRRRWAVVAGVTALWAVGLAVAFQVSAGRLG